jgi:FAD synthase
LRDEKKFENLAQLVKQLELDKEQCSNLIQTRKSS